MFIGERNKAAWRRVAKLCDWIQRGRDNPTQPIRPAVWASPIARDLAAPIIL